MLSSQFLPKYLKQCTTPQDYAKSLSYFLNNKSKVLRDMMEIYMTISYTGGLYRADAPKDVDLAQSTEWIDRDVFPEDYWYQPIRVRPVTINGVSKPGGYDDIIVSGLVLARALNGCLEKDKPDLLECEYVEADGVSDLTEWLKSCSYDYDAALLSGSMCHAYLDFPARIEYGDVVYDALKGDVLEIPPDVTGTITRPQSTFPRMVIALSDTLARNSQIVNDNIASTTILNLLGTKDSLSMADIHAALSSKLGSAVDNVSDSIAQLTTVAADEAADISQRIYNVVQYLTKEEEEQADDVDHAYQDDEIMAAFAPSSYTGTAASSMWSASAAAGAFKSALSVVATVIKAAAKVVWTVLKTVFGFLKRLWKKYIEPAYQSKDFVKSGSKTRENYVDVPIFQLGTQDTGSTFNKSTMAGLVRDALSKRQHIQCEPPRISPLDITIDHSQVPASILVPDLENDMWQQTTSIARTGIVYKRDREVESKLQLSYGLASASITDFTGLEGAECLGDTFSLGPKVGPPVIDRRRYGAAAVSILSSRPAEFPQGNLPLDISAKDAWTPKWSYIKSFLTEPLNRTDLDMYHYVDELEFTRAYDAGLKVIGTDFHRYLYIEGVIKRLKHVSVTSSGGDGSAYSSELNLPFRVPICDLGPYRNLVKSVIIEPYSDEWPYNTWDLEELLVKGHVKITVVMSDGKYDAEYVIQTGHSYDPSAYRYAGEAHEMYGPAYFEGGFTKRGSVSKVKWNEDYVSTIIPNQIQQPDSDFSNGILSKPQSYYRNYTLVIDDGRISDLEAISDDQASAIWSCPHSQSQLLFELDQAGHLEIDQVCLHADVPVLAEGNDEPLTEFVEGMVSTGCSLRGDFDGWGDGLIMPEVTPESGALRQFAVVCKFDNSVAVKALCLDHWVGNVHSSSPVQDDDQDTSNNLRLYPGKYKIQVQVWDSEAEDCSLLISHLTNAPHPELFSFQLDLSTISTDENVVHLADCVDLYQVSVTQRFKADGSGYRTLSVALPSDVDRAQLGQLHFGEIRSKDCYYGNPEQGLVRSRWVGRTFEWYSVPFEALSQETIEALVEDVSTPVDRGCAAVMRYAFGAVQILSDNKDCYRMTAYASPVSFTKLITSDGKFRFTIASNGSLCYLDESGNVIAQYSDDDFTDAFLATLGEAFLDEQAYLYEEGDVRAYKDLYTAYFLMDLLLWLQVYPDADIRDWFRDNTQTKILTPKQWLNSTEVNNQQFVDLLFTNSLPLQYEDPVMYMVCLNIISNKPGFMRAYFIMFGDWPDFFPYLIGDRLADPKWHISTDDDIQNYVDKVCTAVIIAALIIAATIIIGVAALKLKKMINSKIIARNQDSWNNQTDISNAAIENGNLNKEAGELTKKLGDGSLSPEEQAAAKERLTAISQRQGELKTLVKEKTKAEYKNQKKLKRWNNLYNKLYGKSKSSSESAKSILNDDQADDQIIDMSEGFDDVHSKIDLVYSDTQDLQMQSVETSAALRSVVNTQAETTASLQQSSQTVAQIGTGVVALATLIANLKRGGGGLPSV